MVYGVSLSQSVFFSKHFHQTDVSILLYKLRYHLNTYPEDLAYLPNLKAEKHIFLHGNYTLLTTGNEQLLCRTINSTNTIFQLNQFAACESYTSGTQTYD